MEYILSFNIISANIKLILNFSWGKIVYNTN